MIYNYQYPDILHIADRRYDVVHEHLPLREGDIDYSYIFKTLFSDFDGKAILEILDDQAIVESKVNIEGF